MCLNMFHTHVIQNDWAVNIQWFELIELIERSSSICPTILLYFERMRRCFLLSQLANARWRDVWWRRQIWWPGAVVRGRTGQEWVGRMQTKEGEMDTLKFWMKSVQRTTTIHSDITIAEYIIINPLRTCIKRTELTWNEHIEMI